MPHRQIAPFPLFSHIVQLPAALSANPTAQKPLTQSVDVYEHEPVGFFHLCYRVGFQAQLFSDKGLDEHFDPLPFGGPITTALKGLDESGIQAAYSDGNLLHLKPFNLNFTFGIRTREGLSDSTCRESGVALEIVRDAKGMDQLRAALHGGYPGTLDKTVIGTFNGIFHWLPENHPPRVLSVRSMQGFSVHQKPLPFKVLQ